MRLGIGESISDTWKCIGEIGSHIFRMQYFFEKMILNFEIMPDQRYTVSHLSILVLVSFNVTPM